MGAIERRSSIDTSFREKARKEVQSKEAKTEEVLAQRQQPALQRRRSLRKSRSSIGPFDKTCTQFLELSNASDLTGTDAVGHSGGWESPSQLKLELAADEARRSSIQSIPSSAGDDN